MATGFGKVSLINNVVLSQLNSNLDSLSKRRSTKSGSSLDATDLASQSVCDPSLETAGFHQRCKPVPAYERWVKGEEETGFRSVLPLMEEPNMHGAHDAINF